MGRGDELEEEGGDVVELGGFGEAGLGQGADFVHQQINDNV